MQRRPPLTRARRNRQALHQALKRPVDGPVGKGLPSVGQEESLGKARHVLRPAALGVRPQPGGGRRVHGHPARLAKLRALDQESRWRVREVHVGALQTEGLAHAEPRRRKDAEHRPVGLGPQGAVRPQGGRRGQQPAEVRRREQKRRRPAGRGEQMPIGDLGLGGTGPQVAEEPPRHAETGGLGCCAAGRGPAARPGDHRLGPNRRRAGMVVVEVADELLQQ
jgi:hypothetical protein